MIDLSRRVFEAVTLALAAVLFPLLAPSRTALVVRRVVARILALVALSACRPPAIALELPRCIPKQFRRENVLARQSAHGNAEAELTSAEVACHRDLFGPLTLRSCGYKRRGVSKRSSERSTQTEAAQHANTCDPLALRPKQ